MHSSLFEVYLGVFDGNHKCHWVYTSKVIRIFWMLLKCSSNIVIAVRIHLEFHFICPPPRLQSYIYAKHSGRPEESTRIFLEGCQIWPKVLECKSNLKEFTNNSYSDGILVNSASSVTGVLCVIPGRTRTVSSHDDVIKWKHFPRYWPFVRRIHRSPVNSPHKGQWRGALMFSLICVWMNGWVNNREAGD